ncbi:hypothetical protein Pint_03318 [Pistacia integerrima]|uniref:Uncharacterized protein n=1 Tax=Pistacia integerrima TaxID=434235 RepID=A0ACC0ZL89_9ROSI|nr:hypothetical protein Pint_03318 [Pistacia integerrima]
MASQFSNLLLRLSPVVRSTPRSSTVSNVKYHPSKPLFFSSVWPSRLEGKRVHSDVCPRCSNSSSSSENHIQDVLHNDLLPVADIEEDALKVI